MATYHHKLNAIALLPQRTMTGLTPGSPAAFTATSGGSGTTIISTDLQGDADSADDYVGYLVEAVGGTAANLGHMRKVVYYDDGTGTLTTESWPTTCASGDRYRLWIPPTAWWAAETAATSGASGVIHDALRTETAAWCVGATAEGGPYLHAYVASALPSASFAIITAISNGYVKTAHWSGAGVSIGDLVEAVYFPEIMNDALLTLEAPPVDRNGPVGSYGRPVAARGNRAVSGSLELAFRGPGASRVGSHAEAHYILSCVCDVTDPADATIDAGATTTNIPVSSGTPVAGSMYAITTGDILMCSAFSSPNATASPALRVAPESGQTLYGITTYKPSTGANRAFGVQQWRGDGIKEEFYGCLPAISLSGARGDWLKIIAQIVGADGYRCWKDAGGTAFARPWRPKFTSVAPCRLTDCRVSIGAVELDVMSFGIDLGQQIAPKGGLKNANETGGFDLVNDSPTGNIVAIADANMLGELDSFWAGEEQNLFLQAGAAMGQPGMLGFWAYKARYTGGSPEQADGQVTISLPFEVTLDRTETTLPRWAIGIA